MKEILVIGAAAAVVVIGLAGCAGDDGPKVRTDIEPLSRRVPPLSELTEVVWTEEVLTDVRVPGPNGYRLVGEGSLAAADAEQWRSESYITPMPLPPEVAAGPSLGGACTQWLGAGSFANEPVIAPSFVHIATVDLWVCEDADLLRFSIELW